jgi:hypothetical protein
VNRAILRPRSFVSSLAGVIVLPLQDAGAWKQEKYSIGSVVAILWLRPKTVAWALKTCS